MIKIFIPSLISILLIISPIANANTLPTLAHQISADYRFFYTSSAGISSQLIGLGIAGITANTDFDVIFQDEWQQKIRSPFLDDLSDKIDIYTEFTQYQIAIPLYLASMWFSDSSLGSWGNHALRTLILGAPQQAVLAYALGGGRPDTQKPQWHWFRYHRAVSGHAFYGAIPFLNLARETNDTRIKALAYLLSPLPGLARINLNKHYFSQSFLGWWLAFAATNAVWEADIVSSKSKSWSVQLIPAANNTLFLGFNLKF